MYIVYIDSNDSILVKTWTLNSYKIIVINDNNNNISSIFFHQYKKKYEGLCLLSVQSFDIKDVINIKKRLISIIITYEYYIIGNYLY